MGETRINDRTSRESCQRRGRLSSSFATSVDANHFVLAELPRPLTHNSGVQNERTSLVEGTAVSTISHRRGTSDNNLNRSSSTSYGHDDRLAGTLSTPATSSRRRLNPNHDESPILLVRSIQIDEEVELQDLMEMIDDDIVSR
ncbi:predicted protein [Chaetoceros tenuissimus]|uniref:Uncharacterized protein n=1 Tax=Chaetoceros tenuissimus TaxID=426638 RepID=A0AAD3D1S9_9STRA|nr:predicted protein [Chaetoceros tenuissimus]